MFKLFSIEKCRVHQTETSEMCSYSHSPLCYLPSSRASRSLIPSICRTVKIIAVCKSSGGASRVSTWRLSAVEGCCPRDVRRQWLLERQPCEGISPSWRSFASAFPWLDPGRCCMMNENSFICSNHRTCWPIGSGVRRNHVKAAWSVLIMKLLPSRYCLKCRRK